MKKEIIKVIVMCSLPLPATLLLHFMAYIDGELFPWHLHLYLPGLMLGLLLFGYSIIVIDKYIIKK